jgi:ankyrin repeat protein
MRERCAIFMDTPKLHDKVLSADLDAIKELIAQDVDLNELDVLGHSALHWAVFRGDYAIVKLLLEAGANPSVFSTDGVTPKWRAQDFGLVEIETVLSFYGGKVLTNRSFDRTSFSIFNQAIGRSLPKEDKS